VEPDESCIDAAVREAREEVGVEIRAEDLEPVCAMHRTHGNHEWIDERADFFFQVWTWSGEPSLREPAKAAALRWWPLQALPTRPRRTRPWCCGVCSADACRRS
jgi:ADP-ribose pyrophosphatase YjhB (NUDIX family)